MLSVNNLNVVYNGVVQVLDGVSLEVTPGQTVALLGPNGAGKTSFLRAVSGLLPLHDGAITAGQLLLNGQPLQGLAADKIVSRGVVQVMEGRRIFAELTVAENLKLGSWLRQDKQVTADLAAYYAQFPRLAERRQQQAGLLSGGEQQMLAIARAMMAQPKLLLLDEPSLGLSPKLVTEVAHMIRAIAQTGVSILLVEQNAHMALAVADHAYIMDSGRVVLDGAAAELKNDPDVQEFYLGMGEGQQVDYSQVKLYRRRKRWLS